MTFLARIAAKNDNPGKGNTASSTPTSQPPRLRMAVHQPKRERKRRENAAPGLDAEACRMKKLFVLRTRPIAGMPVNGGCPHQLAGEQQL